MPLIPKHVSHIQYDRKEKIKTRKSYVVNPTAACNRRAGKAWLTESKSTKGGIQCHIWREYISSHKLGKRATPILTLSEVFEMSEIVTEGENRVAASRIFLSSTDLYVLGLCFICNCFNTDAHRFCRDSPGSSKFQYSVALWESLAFIRYVESSALGLTGAYSQGLEV